MARTEDERKAADRGYRGRTRTDREARGVCIDCGGKRTGEAKRCADCCAANSARNRRRRKGFRLRGRCTDCGLKLLPVYRWKRCGACLRKRADYQRGWMARKRAGARVAKPAPVPAPAPARRGPPRFVRVV